MQKIRVYLDTSVISYLDQQDAPEKMEQTKKVWNLLQSSIYEVVISDLVFEEIEKCNRSKRNILKNFLLQLNYKEASVTKKTHVMAKEIIKNSILKQKSYYDCLHIALAILNDCDIILSWNFKHIVNINTINGIKRITINKNCKNVDIYAPNIMLKGGTIYEKT